MRLNGWCYIGESLPKNEEVLILKILKVALISVFILAFLLQCSNAKDENFNLQNNSNLALSDSLKNVALDFLKSWEPPFDSKMALDLFSNSSDFVLVIDGMYNNKYEDWASNIDNYMEHDRIHYKLYKHIIKDVRTVLLSPTVGVVTIVYVWEYVQNDGKHYKADGAITFVCRIENEKWKIVHYHGSHDNEILIDTVK